MDEPTSAPPPAAGWVRRWIDRILHSTHHHYRNVLPNDPGPVLSRALALFYSGVRLEEPQAAALRQLPADAIVVYTSKFKSDFAFLFAYHRYRHLGLRFPRIGLGGRFFIWQSPSRMLRILLAHADSLLRHGRWPNPYDSGFLRDELLKAEPGFFTLIQKKHFWQRFGKGPVDPVEFLIRLQKTTAQPVLVVPQIMFFGKRPRRANPTLIDMLFGPEDEPGRLRRLALMFKQSGNAFVEISPPISVQRFLERPDIAPHDADYQAAILRGEILAQINRHRQSITGPVIKSRAELRESILSGERFQQFLQSHAQTHGMALTEVRMKAAQYLNEIAAAYSLSWILVYSHIVAWLLRTLFDGLSMNEVVVSRGATASMVELRIDIGSEFVANLRADGLIIASPTGSTAYALSAGGPILHPGIAGLLLVPIASHTLSNRPIVLPDQGEIRIEVVAGRDASANFDMQSLASLLHGDQVRVRRSAHKVRFLHPRGWSYYATLRRKLRWHEGVV